MDGGEGGRKADSEGREKRFPTGAFLAGMFGLVLSSMLGAWRTAGLSAWPEDWFFIRATGGESFDPPALASTLAGLCRSFAVDLHVQRAVFAALALPGFAASLSVLVLRLAPSALGGFAAGFTLGAWAWVLGASPATIQEAWLCVPLVLGPLLLLGSSRPGLLPFLAPVAGLAAGFADPVSGIPWGQFLFFLLYGLSGRRGRTSVLPALALLCAGWLCGRLLHPDLPSWIGRPRSFWSDLGSSGPATDFWFREFGFFLLGTPLFLHRLRVPLRVLLLGPAVLVVLAAELRIRALERVGVWLRNQQSSCVDALAELPPLGGLLAWNPPRALVPFLRWRISSEPGRDLVLLESLDLGAQAQVDEDWDWPLQTPVLAWRRARWVPMVFEDLLALEPVPDRVAVSERGRPWPSDRLSREGLGRLPEALLYPGPPAPRAFLERLRIEPSGEGLRLVAGIQGSGTFAVLAAPPRKTPMAGLAPRSAFWRPSREPVYRLESSSFRILGVLPAFGPVLRALDRLGPGSTARITRR